MMGYRGVAHGGQYVWTALGETYHTSSTCPAITAHDCLPRVGWKTDVPANRRLCGHCQRGV
jgi:hypothetical protein